MTGTPLCLIPSEADAEEVAAEELPPMDREADAEEVTAEELPPRDLLEPPTPPFPVRGGDENTFGMNSAEILLVSSCVPSSSM